MPHCESRPMAEIVLVVGDRDVTIGSVAADARCDLDLVDRLLRLRLAALRAGFTIRIAAVDGDLRDLVDFVGLGERLGC
jgi:hypothetical protein